MQRDKSALTLICLGIFYSFLIFLPTSESIRQFIMSTTGTLLGGGVALLRGESIASKEKKPDLESQ